MTLVEYFDRSKPNEQQEEQLDIINVKLCLLGYKMRKQFLNTLQIHVEGFNANYFIISWEKINAVYIYDVCYKTEKMIYAKTINKLTVDQIINLLDKEV
ncbi:hypothetical protein D3C87_81070 [compost metagenome]